VQLLIDDAPDFVEQARPLLKYSWSPCKNQLGDQREVE
jgi:hypothetical protein